jgi:5-methylcytosine-specific restriction endonuclease McrA
MPAAYELPLPGEPIPARFKLGTICKRGHDWTGKGQSLRYNKPRAGCVLCGRQGSIKRQERRKQEDPEFLAKQAASARKRRAQPGYVRPDRQAKHSIEWHEARALNAAIKRAGRRPSVARLVYDQQLEYWRAHPDDHAEFNRRRGLRQLRWRYMTNLKLRLYNRSKSKQRKARERGSRTVMLSPDQLWRRWVEFDHCCAYCGTQGDLQVEHVIPISKGGEHHLGNIVPACASCNYSKRSAPVEQWYKAQPFFAETRWLAIQAALAKGQPMTEQLAMRLCA